MRTPGNRGRTLLILILQTVENGVASATFMDRDDAHAGNRAAFEVSWTSEEEISVFQLTVVLSTTANLKLVESLQLIVLGPTKHSILQRSVHPGFSILRSQLIETAFEIGRTGRDGRFRRRA